MANIRKLTNGKYQIQVYDVYRKRHRLVFVKKGEAVAYISKIEAKKHELDLVSKKLIKMRISFDSAVQDYWSTKLGLRPKTCQKYQMEIEQINQFRKSRNIIYIDEFTREDADAFREKLIKSGAAPKTVNSYLTRLKCILNEQVLRDHLIKNYAGHLKNIPKHIKTMLEKEAEYYTEDEVRSFFGQVMDSEYRNAFLALYLTGMRYEEMASLKWDQVNLEDKMIYIRSRDDFVAKTISSERDIPISDYLYSVLIKTTEDKRQGYVFPSTKGEKISERTLLTICKKVAKDAGISKTATLHMYRHTWSSLLSQLGISYEVREFLLGDKPQGSLTGHYTKLDAKKYHAVVSLLDKYIEQKR